MKPHPNEMLLQYLIESCLRLEFGCSQMEDSDYEKLSVDLWVQQRKVDHPHRNIVDFDRLRETSDASHIRFPSITRHCAARLACQTPGSMLHTRTLAIGQDNALMHWRQHEEPLLKT